jgi:hypothetical protein
MSSGVHQSPPKVGQAIARALPDLRALRDGRFPLPSPDTLSAASEGVN